MKKTVTPPIDAFRTFRKMYEKKDSGFSGGIWFLSILWVIF